MQNEKTFNVSNPAAWHRAICWAAAKLIVTGDLADTHNGASAQLRSWRDAGVTHIVDVRGERNDSRHVADFAPEITYIFAGVDDSGGRRSDSWFEYVVSQLGDAIHDPNCVILVHCHMGVNRGPSMALRIMLEQGWDCVDALNAIRAARPIAAVLYSADSVDHFHKAHGSPDTIRFGDRRRAKKWHEDNPIDISWIISRIRLAG